MKTVFIYVLKEPDTGEIRYIGKSDNPKKRLCAHMSRSKSPKDHRSCWVRSLLVRGTRPVLEIIDKVPETLWESAEMGYIHLYKSQGCDLVNGTPGGDSGPITSGDANPFFGKKHTKEAKEKMADASRGNQYCVGFKHTEDTCKNMSDSQKGNKKRFGKTHSEATKKQISDTKTGAPVSIETRNIFREAGKNSPATLEQCRNMCQNNVGSKRTPEQKEKQSAKRKLWWERKRQEEILDEMWR